MRKWIAELGQILEEKKTSIGSFGGKKHFWPDTGSRWDAMDWDFDVNNDAYMIQYQHYDPSFVFVTFNASQWLATEGSKPIEYKTTIVGVKKPVATGTIKSPKDVMKVLDQAAKKAKDTVDRVDKVAPTVSGWKRYKYRPESGLAYEKSVGGKHSDAGITVTFQDPEQVMLSGAPAEVDFDYSAGADYMGAFGVKAKTLRWKSMNDIKKILGMADQFAEKARGA